MPRFFNSAGPNKPDISYTIDPLSRIDLKQRMPLIDAERYFIMRAPRQSGRTSALIALMKHLNEGGRYRALCANIEAGQAAREDVQAAMPAIIQAIGGSAAIRIDEPQTEQLARNVSKAAASGNMLQAFLREWCRQTNKPSVLV